MVKKLLTAAVTAAARTFTATAGAAPPPVGGLTQLGCFTIAGGVPNCTPARGIDGAESAVLSPDGKNVYVGSYKRTGQEGLAAFSRDPATGTLTQLPGRAGCLTGDGASARP